MPAPTDNSELTPREAADISALADGTLDPARRPQIQAWIAASPERTALYERERHVVELLHRARSTERAPERLRARVEARRPSRVTMTRRRIGYSGGLAAALAVVVLALVLLLPSGSPGAPSVSQAASVAVRGPVGPAPAPDPQAPGYQLAQSVGSLYFPNWTSAFGWRATGQRTDSLHGRKLVTVYYQGQHERVAYTIVSTPALPAPSAKVSYRNGLELRTLTLDGRLVVTWTEDGHTCILSGQNVPAAALQALASWTPAAIR